MSTTSLAARVAAPVMEVFASIQGEGLHVGEPQVFLRMRGCPLRCRWCDTPGSWTLGEADVARIAGAQGIERQPAWATPFQAACWIAAAEPGAPRTVSLTGGEPLMWPEFVTRLKPLLGERRLHLETAGGHPKALAAVLPVVDHVSLDLKLAADLDAPVELERDPTAHVAGDGDGEDASCSTQPTDEPAPASPAAWSEARRRCLALVRGRDACGKIVIAGGRAAGEYAELLEDVVSHAPELTVILQPATPMNGVPAPAADVVTDVCEAARELSLRVRVLPQVHRALRIP